MSEQCVSKHWFISIKESSGDKKKQEKHANNKKAAPDNDEGGQGSSREKEEDSEKVDYLLTDCMPGWFQYAGLVEYRLSSLITSVSEMSFIV